MRCDAKLNTSTSCCRGTSKAEATLTEKPSGVILYLAQIDGVGTPSTNGIAMCQGGVVATT